jgi:hypothetical protein
MEEFYASLSCVSVTGPCSGDSFVRCSVTIDVFLAVKNKIINFLLLNTTGRMERSGPSSGAPPATVMRNKPISR